MIFIFNSLQSIFFFSISGSFWLIFCIFHHSVEYCLWENKSHIHRKRDIFLFQDMNFFFFQINGLNCLAGKYSWIHSSFSETIFLFELLPFSNRISISSYVCSHVAGQNISHCNSIGTKFCS